MAGPFKPYLDHFISRYQIDISVYDPAFLEKTIYDRISELQLGSLPEYMQYLDNNEDEPCTLQHRLINSYSEFFRNPITFAYLEQVIIPQLFERKRNGKAGEIRIWSAACAAGQEAYSLAMLCCEQAKKNQELSNCRIFATDIATSELDIARKGEYPAEALGKVTLQRVQTYFQRQNEIYTIQPTLKKVVDFSVFDLLSENGSCPPASIYGNFDLVFCSNLLFYYKPKIREIILEKVGKTLAKGGYLITGETERDILKESGFREIFDNSAIFQKR
jgi:chemotaxis methyl-accepting protein methylase